MPEHNIETDEISLKELILLIKKYISEVFKFWWLVIIVAGIFVGLMVFKELGEPTTYTSSLSFMLNEESANPLGAVSGLLGNFGLGGGSASNIEKMIKLMKSRNVIKNVLLKKAVIDGKEDYFANHILKTEEIEIFIDEEETELFYFKTDSFSRFDTLENTALLTLYGYLVGTEDNVGILNVSVDELSGFFYMDIKTLNEKVAVEFIIKYFEEIDQYYVTKAIESNYKTYSILKTKADSLRALASSKAYELAQEADQGRAQYLIVSSVKAKELSAELEFIQMQLGEILKNKELSEFTLLSLTPTLQIVDAPIYPIEPEEPSLIKAIVIGGFIGGFLSVCFILARRIYKDVMEDEVEIA